MWADGDMIYYCRVCRIALSAAIIATLCVLLWLGLDIVREVAGRGAALALSALIFVICVTLIRLTFTTTRQR
jgi:hypothetical protein